MFNPSSFEKIRHKIVVKTMPLFAPLRKMFLKQTDFTIISNNCWGGVCYEYFGLPKQSPTVGTFLFARDYIKFVKDLRNYLNYELTFLQAEKSRHYDYIKKNNILCPIGLLGDIEIFFLHYPNENITRDKKPCFIGIVI